MGGNLFFLKKRKNTLFWRKTTNEFWNNNFISQKFRYHITKRYGYRPLINTPGIHHHNIHEQSGHMICLLAFPEIYISLPHTQVSNNIHTSPTIHEKREWILQFSLLHKVQYREPYQVLWRLISRYENPNARKNCKLFSTVNFICS